MKVINAPKDFLTNCYSREGIFPFLKKMEEEYLAYKKPFATLVMDVDHFKSFNDKHGHLTGDEVLKYFSSSMRLDLEDEENVPFRFGGDEFIMIFPNKTANEAYHLANRLKNNIHTRPCLVKGKQIFVTFSGGIASYPTDANTVEDILEKADKALYASKNRGRNRITKFSDLGHQELVQVLAVVLVLAFVGVIFYVFRDVISQNLGKIESLLFRSSATPPKSSKPAPLTANEWTPPKPMEKILEESLSQAPTAVTGPAAAPAASPQGQKKSLITLESGRTIQGIIESDDGEVVKVNVGLQEGKAYMQIKKTQILRIEPVE